MDYKKVASEILEAVGSSKNIQTLGHCATRLRINLKDMEKAEIGKVKKIKGVVGAVSNPGQFQVVIGPDVGNVYSAMLELGNFKTDNQQEVTSKKPLIPTILDMVSGIFTPALPAIVAAGMVQAVIVLLTTFGVVEEGSSTLLIFKVISNAAFYFLPVLLAFTAAQKFKCNPFIAVSLAGIMLHPDLIALMGGEAAVTFFGLGVTKVSYVSSVVPIILSVWIMHYVERLADKISPNCIKFLLKPLLTILVMTPITLVIVGPLGTIAGNYLSQAILFLNSKAGWLVLMFMGAFSPLIIMTGMHYSLFPLTFQSLATLGYDTIMSVGCLPSNMAQGASCLCVALKTKNKELRQVATSSGITALLGITEPALYGVTMKLKKPLVAVMAGGAAGGLYAGIVGLKSFGFVTPGLAAFPVYIGPNGNLVNFFVTCLIAFALSFLLTWVLGFQDEPGEEVAKQGVDKAVGKLVKRIKIKSPLKGQLVSLEEVNDKVFSDRILGKGVAVIPDEGMVVSPFEGIVTSLFPSKHAIGITSLEGCEVLIHIGLETVKLDGKYFESFVEEGDAVNTGDMLIAFQKDAIMEAGYDIITPVIVTNTGDYLDIIEMEPHQVGFSEEIISVVSGRE